MYHYPYVYYPQNFWGSDYYRSSEDCTSAIRRRCESRATTSNGKTSIPSTGDPYVKPSQFFPMCPERRSVYGRRYHYGHHFIADVF